MKKGIASILLSLFIIGSALAQDEKTETKAHDLSTGHHLGLFAGASSGYGLSYRYFKDQVGFQLATTPIFASDETHFSIGGELLRSFGRTKYTNFYGYLAYHYNYNKYVNDWDYQSTEEINVTSISGFGVGFELIAAGRISFNWQLGYAFYYFDKDDWRTMIDGGFGIFYKF